MANVPDTQTQTQQSGVWTQVDSQPVEKPIWGRLYAKNLKIKSLDLCNDVFKVGRDDDNDLSLNKDHLPTKVVSRISKVHFLIVKDLQDQKNPVYIIDESRNGTFVNGNLVGPHNKMILKNDDVIALSHPQYKSLVYKDLTPNEAGTLPTEIHETYYVSKKLGKGAYGEVHLVYDAKTCKAYAMKAVAKNQLAEWSKKNLLSDPKRVMNEVNIMKSLDHPCVIKMHDIVNKPESVFMILEFMKGGDLLSRIINHKYLSEEASKLFFLQMCHAVKYLHTKGITHRDLKPDNILLEDDRPETLLKVSDFGLSKFVNKGSILRTLCGTPQYVAPEILIKSGCGSYTPKVDIWSLGVVLFTMLSGSLPFSDEYGTPATEQIKRAKFTFRHHVWKSVSGTAKKLIYDMLTADPNSRPSIDKILSSTWLRDAETIKKAEKLMNMKLIGTKKASCSDVENSNEQIFAEPPRKRARK
ncbi:ovarian-specific serine/threonine-protein kinase Lok isoform X2 [Toxorhynchites rutilus septentrionalis]|uniref:ovarian-specific serine/threonine-protein kinase Lok isoform X2 n=1 Tax=Toxorhynchites rutilus septentrionalis TaxID=329112 RepID=UPI00247AA866|nr:ovarian-specific serine/threonine-protein kinase Lok isoform X2 [Toxorhynchites rutilus septentrionalis]